MLAAKLHDCLRKVSVGCAGSVMHCQSEGCVGMDQVLLMQLLKMVPAQHVNNWHSSDVS